ncbi:thiamine phosphate synthase [Alcanivorax sp. 1008]|uniref:thiamine phosphate synthase n=1 Tax=Alcanivorax sp. 1008 TaxID=2816853 RepID=UPI001DD3986C|nr:thiamine phosphate synthase [Alcanivorax sp. 1008]
MAKIRGLYAITDPALIPPERLLVACQAALNGGVRLLQYRDKPATNAERRKRAISLRELCRDHDALLLINDDPQLAADIGASGVHIGQSDGAVQRARQLLGPDAIIGVTCHNDPDLAIAAARAGADYVAFGRFYPSHSKPGAPAANPAVLSTPLPLPKVAIGGITPDNASALIAAGADAVAVIHSLFSAADIEGQARLFANLFSVKE